MRYYGDPNSLEDFKEWWLFHKTFDPPADALCFLPGLHSVVLFRQDQFQVELFTTEPNKAVHRHRHPLTEMYQYTLAGDLSAMVNMTQVTEADHSFMNEMYISPKMWHKAYSGERGASYLSIQRWLDGTPPSFLVNSWQDQKKATSLRQYFEESK